MSDTKCNGPRDNRSILGRVSRYVSRYIQTDRMIVRDLKLTHHASSHFAVFFPFMARIGVASTNIHTHRDIDNSRLWFYSWCKSVLYGIFLFINYAQEHWWSTSLSLFVMQVCAYMIFFLSVTCACTRERWWSRSGRRVTIFVCRAFINILFWGLSNISFMSN